MLPEDFRHLERKSTSDSSYLLMFTKVERCFALLPAVLCLAATILLGGCVLPQRNMQAMPIKELSENAAPQSFVSDGLASDSRRYRLSVGDQIEVRYLRQLPLSTTVTVGPDGTVSLPFLPSVPAEGKTIDELRESLQQQYLTHAASGPAPGAKQYLIGVGDVLEIKFPFFDEYNETVTVRPDGKISLPLVDSIIVEGKSPEDVKNELIGVYSQYLEKTVLVLNVVSSASHSVIADGKRFRVPISGLDSLYITLKSAERPKVYIAGEVERPAAIPYEPMMSSLQAIIAAGGATNDAELRNVVIVRKGVGDSPRYIVRNLWADINGESAQGKDLAANGIGPGGQTVSLTNDIFLHPFDVVIVPKTTIANVRDVLDSYIFDLLPPLGNSSLGFSFTKPVGTQKIKQDTNIVP